MTTWPMRISCRITKLTDTLTICRAHAEPDGPRAETTFCFPPKRTSPFKSAGESVQSTAGSRGVRISVCNAGYTTCRGGVRVLVTPSIHQFPLHFPSRELPCATTFRTQYTSPSHFQTCLLITKFFFFLLLFFLNDTWVQYGTSPP